jgi:hypothetical protein
MTALNLNALLTNVISDGYRKTLKQLADMRKELAGSDLGSYQRLATACGVQKSYLSKVFGENAHLNEDQLFCALEFLKITGILNQLITLQLGIERSGSKARRDHLSEQLRLIVAESKRTEKSVAGTPQLTDEQLFSDYYSEPLAPIVHMHLLVPRFAKKPQLIRQALLISDGHFTKILTLLEKAKVLTRDSTGALLVSQDHFHLPRQSHLQPAFQSFTRLKALERVTRSTSTEEDDFRYAVYFTSDEKTKNEVLDLFREFLTQASEKIRTSPSNEVYQLIFDLNCISNNQ